MEQILLKIKTLRYSQLKEQDRSLSRKTEWKGNNEN